MKSYIHQLGVIWLGLMQPYLETEGWKVNPCEIGTKEYLLWETGFVYGSSGGEIDLTTAPVARAEGWDAGKIWSHLS